MLPAGANWPTAHKKMADRWGRNLSAWFGGVAPAAPSTIIARVELEATGLECAPCANRLLALRVCDHFGNYAYTPGGRNSAGMQHPESDANDDRDQGET